jgi:hypothetical protein
MYILNIIDLIKNICISNISNISNILIIELYNKIKKILEQIDNKIFLEDFKTFNCNTNILIKNNITSNAYIKHILFTSKEVDIIVIEWEKYSKTYIHDHPEKGCIVKVLYGELEENCYDDKLNFINNNILYQNDIGYKISNKILHNIYAKENTFSLHVYIPGKFICSVY